MIRAALLIACVLATCTMVSAQFYPYCKYNFCYGGVTIKVGGEFDKALSAPICKGRKKLGTVNLGLAWLLEEDSRYYYFTPIEYWHPRGLKQQFSPSFFKAYPAQSDSSKSGIGHETPQQNQLRYLNRRSWVIPLKSAQIVGPHSMKVRSNANYHYFGDNCISFKTRT